MNEEIEIQVAIGNPKQAESKVSSNAEFVREIIQRDDYFIPAHEDYFKASPVRKYLRIRVEEEKSEIGFHLCHLKGNELINTEEFETTVGNAEGMKKILQHLDMKKKVTVEKKRKIFETEKFEIVIDRVKNLGDFIEIEVKEWSGTAKEAKKACYSFLKDLNIDYKETPEKGYCEQLIKSKKG